MSLSNNNNEQGGGSPPPNPVLTAYESFVRDTPLVTRYVLTTLFSCWILSVFFMDLTFALSNIPYFSILKFELYRIIFSPLLCTSIISLIFAVMSFLDNGKRLEFSMGSTQYAYLLLTIGVLSNLGLICFSFLMYGISGGESSWLFLSSDGIWTLLFGMIAIECSKAPPNSQRRFIAWTVPTLYYPVILVVIFSFLGGNTIPYCISLGVGYAYGYGYLDKVKLSSARCKTWEDTILINFTRREGWIVGNAAKGDDAWNDTADTLGSASSGFRFFRPPGDQSSEGAGFPSGGGQTLGGGGGGGGQVLGGGHTLGGDSTLGGGPTRRDAAEARAARLQALDDKV